MLKPTISFTLILNSLAFHSPDISGLLQLPSFSLPYESVSVKGNVR